VLIDRAGVGSGLVALNFIARPVCPVMGSVGTASEPHHQEEQRGKQ
jgi:hypothetical protein